MRAKVGAAVFVKTPGLTPLKTRLAVGIGAQAAETFYRLCCLALEELLLSVSDLRAYWALAESTAAARSFPLWARLPQLEQGEGSLGERLDRVYQRLLSEHRAALLLGADTPQLPKVCLETAVQRSRAGEIVIGPADDGGFYLFASSAPVPREVWTRVRYSEPDTLKQLLEALGEPAPLHFLPPLRDVDTADDLAPALDFMAGNEPLANRHIDILAWHKQLQLENLKTPSY